MTPFKKEFIDDFLDIAECVIVAIVAAILILTLLFRTGYVDGESMLTTMSDSDRYIVSNLFYTPKAGDIVVFEPDLTESDGIENNEKLYVKRIIATEGQRLQITKDENDKYAVYVDGQKLDEPYLDDWQITYPRSQELEQGITIPDGHFFAMGDNRIYSKDCRIIGCVDNRRLLGKILFRFFPLDKIGFIN